MVDNFTLKDIFGSLLAFSLFSLIFVAPGYVIGWLFDLFDFRSRSYASCFVIAMVLSMAASPILFFLIYYFTSSSAAISAILLIGILFAIILLKTSQVVTPPESKSSYRTALLVAFFWILFSVLFVVDFQWGGHLYYNIISHDLATRVAIINAITRSGVPPINPGYYPEHPVRLTYLYYFWYIPCSLVAQIGSPLVSGYTAMIASIIWCGLALMAAIALYLRLRNPENGMAVWKSSLRGIGLLLISGLDIIPALGLIFATRLYSGSAILDGDMEHWNEQITAWIGSVSWAPHHVAALIACTAAVMLIQSIRGQVLSKQIKACLIAALALASAIGLSIYVTLVFILFWGVWMLVSVFEKEWRFSLVMALTGIIAVAIATPFLSGLIGENNSTPSIGIPLIFSVRIFMPVLFFFSASPPLILNLILLFALPLNYFMELGFFFVTGVLWVHQHWKTRFKQNPFYPLEIILLSVTVLIGSFVQSTSITSNDLGWRAWLPGQFILLVWSVDVINEFFPNGWKKSVKFLRPLGILIVLGLLTTLTDIVILRSWPILVDTGIAGFPNGLSPDTQLGTRTFAARQAYDLVDRNTPLNAIIQYNPSQKANRPVGLYSNRQMVISDLTAYGVSTQEFNRQATSISDIFKETNWENIDASCKKYSINVLVMNDLDPIWKKLPILEQQRKPIYQNQYYAGFYCNHSMSP